MTTKPKAKKYRIRRGGTLAGGVAKSEAAAKAQAQAQAQAQNQAQGKSQPPEEDMFGTEDGFGDEKYPTAGEQASGPAEPPQTDNGDLGPTDIEEIKKEGLTGRQLRLARRIAQKRGFAVTSDYDAVRVLRANGIDPFKRSTMLELVVPNAEKTGGGKIGLPKTLTQDAVPSTEVYDEASRAKEILRIQRDIARRRRRQLSLLWARLAFFVVLPTVVMGYYFFVVATPLYATKSEFVIQQADSSGGGGLGSLFSGTGFATSQDSITVQSYLQSRDAMIRLNEEVGFKDHFSGDVVDPFRRLTAGGSNEEAYRLYRRMVLISYDPTEGLIRMEVIATDPTVSREFSLALIRYAEEQVDNLTQRLRADQMQGSRESFEEAEAKMLDAQQRVLDLQERLGIIDPTTETSALMGQITNFETQVQEKRLQLQQLLDNQRPNQARVDGVKGDINRLEKVITDLRSQLTQSGENSASLAKITGEMRMAEVDLETRQAMMTQALQQLETARIEANRQVRYLSLGVSPTAPDEATYPRAFENTIVSLLIFSGIYLMASLTVSILREQVSG